MSFKTTITHDPDTDTLSREVRAEPESAPECKYDGTREEKDASSSPTSLAHTLKCPRLTARKIGKQNLETDTGVKAGRFFRRREQDLESGAGGPDSLSGDPDGYPQLAEDSMVRRFGWLHRRLLLYRHYELQSLEAELRDLDEQTENQEFQGDSRGTRPYLARDSLLEAINSQLSAYDSMLLTKKSLRQQVPKPTNGCYTNAREWIRSGPPIHLDYSDTNDPRWQEYTSAVTKLLNESIKSNSLNCSIDHYWTKDLGKPLKSTDREWMTSLKQKWDSVKTIMAILFWIGHVTAAVGFALIVNATGYQASQASSDKTLAQCLLAFWYFSATIIVTQGFKHHGYLYARKIILGGVVACGGGFYTLKLLSLASTADAMTGLPAFFTFVLLLVKTM